MGKLLALSAAFAALAAMAGAQGNTAAAPAGATNGQSAAGLPALTAGSTQAPATLPGLPALTAGTGSVSSSPASTPPLPPLPTVPLTPPPPGAGVLPPLPPQPGSPAQTLPGITPAPLPDLPPAPKPFAEGIGAPAPIPTLATPAPVAVIATPTAAPTPARATSSYIEPVVTKPCAAPRLTPRNTELSVYPAPAITPPAAGGLIGPYGPGLAAAAPVGTPYLRSPAFAGPPIIYMPQTVSRVLLPGVTPYPSNVMHPPAQYVYSSAPFLRTDIYVDLPYGTFYWPQGYAGSTPVEPQVAAYSMAPAVAVMSEEASYSTQRYDPNAAHPETLNAVKPGEAAAAAQVPPTVGPSSISTGVTDLEAVAPMVPVPLPGAPTEPAKGK